MVEIDPSDKTGSFVSAMTELNRFLPSSKRQFLDDALMHLNTLETGSDERTRLADALDKARKDGHLSEAHTKVLDKLNGGPEASIEEETSTPGEPKDANRALIYRSKRRDTVGR